MRRAYATTMAVAAVCVLALATAACDRRGGASERDPEPVSVVQTTTRPAPPLRPQEPAAVVDQTAPDLTSVDELLVEVERDLASVDAPPPDAD